jgi:transposase
MPRTRNPYPVEFREQIVELARSGRSVEELAREFHSMLIDAARWPCLQSAAPDLPNCGEAGPPPANPPH